MKKINKLLIGIVGLILFSGIVYASLTTASINKSTYIPWQGTPSGHYDSAHNVGSTFVVESRFSFVSGSSAGGSSTVLDSVTGLTWQSNGITQGTMNWDDAKTYCTSLTLGGETDWKLPNLKELQSIIDFTRSLPAIDTTFFTVSNSYYWSSTTYENNTSNAWVVYFDNGSSTFSNKTLNNYVRCIR